MIVGGQTSARALTIIDYHQLSWTIMRRLTRALKKNCVQKKNEQFTSNLIEINNTDWEKLSEKHKALLKKAFGITQ